MRWRWFALALLSGLFVGLACEDAGVGGTSSPPTIRTAATRELAFSTVTPAATAAPTAGVDAQSGCVPPPISVPPAIAEVFCVDPASYPAARVVRIIDGDTLVAMVDGQEETVRLFGIDAPERGDRCSAEATRRLEELAGDEIRLRSDVRNRGPYGRLLRYVYTHRGVSTDAMLIAEGLAEAWTRDGALRAPLIALEDAARAADAGCLWR